jgi:LAGLIDADG endonuclease
VTACASDNPDGAEDQQERLVALGWVLGFVDGEGCFSVGFVRQLGGPGRRAYRTGWQVTHEFAVSQGASSIGCLHELQRFFGVGGLIANRRHDNHREPMYRFAVRNRTDLLETVIPFFEEHPLRSAKRADFEKFAQIVWMVDNGCHLTPAGLVEIAEIAQTMNRRKDRSELIRILRGHTPEVQDTGS